MTAVGCQAGGGVGEAPRGLLSPEAQFHGLLVWCDTDSEVHMENFSKGKQTSLPLHHSHCRCCQYHYQLMCSASPPPTPTRPLGGCVCVWGGGYACARCRHRALACLLRFEKPADTAPAVGNLSARCLWCCQDRHWPMQVWWRCALPSLLKCCGRSRFNSLMVALQRKSPSAPRAASARGGGALRK